MARHEPFSPKPFQLKLIMRNSPVVPEVVLPFALVRRILSYIHPRPVHRLRLCSRAVNECILDKEFAIECLINNGVSLSDPQDFSDVRDSASSLSSLRLELDRIVEQMSGVTVGNRRSMVMLPRGSPSEYDELMFLWPDTWRDVFATHFGASKSSFGKVIGPRVNNVRNSSISKKHTGLRVPRQIADFKNLIRLDLGMCGIFGQIPESIFQLTHLEFLDLGRNRIDGSIPSSIGMLGNLRVLDLQNNNFSGDIPAAIGNLSNLVHILMNENEFSGSIPQEIGKLQKLVTLNLSKNKLSGRIPDEICDLANLTQLVLSDNKLTGVLPQSIGRLHRLRRLYLNKNKLTGEIPESVGRLVELRQFVCSNNNLSGAIPVAVGRLRHLEMVDTHGNAQLGEWVWEDEEDEEQEEENGEKDNS
ncbi:hypothetical protein HDU84_004330 [Entophlyctis sp. JEL0112]|nr:hypothetical protein HDU84_004330 [Entophlyctis sp. JEL0112]